MKWRHRLYVRIYLSLLAALAITVAVIAVSWRYTFEGGFMRTEFVALAQDMASEILPPSGASLADLQRALDRWGMRVHADLTLYDSNRQPLISSGGGQALLPADQVQSGWIHARREGPALALHLNDGRWLVGQHDHRTRPRPIGFVLSLIVIAAILGVLAYPLSRRLALRLERLQQSVDALGEGNLSVRVPVQGRDEIASLAGSFNRSAQRIEALVTAQKSLLANASHELRSPLARLRLAAESLQQGASPALLDHVREDIAELDQLIDEILLSSRLESTVAETHPREEVDLTGIVAEECARVDAELEAEPVVLHGNPILLRRMIRNLLENARRYGAGTPVEVRLARDIARTITLSVCDRGPGIPEHEREKIFQPFYRAEGAAERHGGVGLGLALVRQIAGHHHAQVKCRAREGGGSCFVVSLPGGEARSG